MGIGDEKLARIRLEATSSKLGDDLRQARDKLRKFGREVKTSLGNATPTKWFRAAAGAATKATSTAVGSMGRGFLEKAGAGVFELATSGARETLDYERSLSRFQIATGRSDEKMNGFRIALTNMSKEMGISKGELLSGASSYVALTGDAEGAATSVKLFGRVSLASGAAMSDIAATAAALKDNLKIDPADFEGAFSTMIAQGKAGAIELKDLAQQLAGVAPQFTAFRNGMGVQGLTTLGAALQVARKGFGSAGEAATGLRALMVAINRNASKFKSVKVGGKYGFFQADPKTGKKSLKDFKQIIDGISASKIAKDPELLTKAFGSDEAKRAYDQLVLNRGLLTDLEKQFESNGQVSEDSMKYQESAAGKIEIAMENLKAAVAQAFTPANITAFANSLMEVSKFLANIVAAMTAIQEFMDVKEKKDKNERELAEMGEYTGDNRDLMQISTMKAARNRLEEEKQRPVLRAARAAKTLQYAGAGELAMPDLYSRPEPTYGAPLGMRTSGPRAPLDPMGRSELPRAPAPEPFLPSIASQSRAPVEVVLKLDGDEVARAVANAKSQRRKPGGR